MINLDFRQRRSSEPTAIGEYWRDPRNMDNSMQNYSYTFILLFYFFLVNHAYCNVHVTNRPFPRYSWSNAKVACTYQNLAFNFHKPCSRGRYWETNDSMIILLFPSFMSISNQSIVNQNYFENEALVSTARQHSLSISRILIILGKVYYLNPGGLIFWYSHLLGTIILSGSTEQPFTFIEGTKNAMG